MVLNAETLPKNLTERRFRSYWEQTIGANARERFTLVEHLMAKDLILATRKGSSITDSARLTNIAFIVDPAATKIPIATG